MKKLSTMFDKLYTRIKVCFSSRLVSIATLLTTIVSLIALIMSYSGIQGEVPLKISILYYLALFFSVILLCFILIPLFTAKVYDKNKQTADINEYMANLYRNATGKIVVSTTGGMNWVTPQILDILEEKSKSSGVVVFVPNKNQKTSRLERAGAKIIDRSNLGIIPNLNFSIVNPGADDALIAIGRRSNKNIHYITEYEAKSDVMVVARELSSFLEKI